MSKRNLGMAMVLCVAFAMIVTQSFLAQAPQAPAGPPAAGQAPAGAPGGAPGGGRGGAGGGGGRGGGGGAPAVPAGPIVRGADGKPDFTGYYLASTCTNIETNCARNIVEPAPGGKVPYNAEWAAKSADTTKNHMFDEPYAHCLPAGVPTNFGIQMGFQVVHDKTTIAFSWDTVGATRLIYLDGRKHIPANIKLYQADSIGQWEGDTLVVDSTSQAAGWLDASGHVHSDAIHVVEKFTAMDSNNIAYEAIVEDPIAFTAPMKFTDTFRRNLGAYPNSWGKRPTGYEQTETACVEGDMDMAMYPVSAGGTAKDAPPSTQGVTAAPPRGGAGGGRGGGGAPGGGRGAPPAGGGAPPAQ